VANIPYCQQNSLLARKYWSAMACISGSIRALYFIHDNPLACKSGSFFCYFYIGISVKLLFHLENFTFKFKWM